MRKIDKTKADRYFRERVRLIVLYLLVWAAVSFGVVLFANSLSNMTVNGFPFHYFMGAQGAIIVFIALLFINAYVSDRIDEKYGIDEKKNETIGIKRTLNH